MKNETGSRLWNQPSNTHWQENKVRTFLTRFIYECCCLKECRTLLKLDSSNVGFASPTRMSKGENENSYGQTQLPSYPVTGQHHL